MSMRFILSFVLSASLPLAYGNPLQATFKFKELAEVKSSLCYSGGKFFERDGTVYCDSHDSGVGRGALTIIQPNGTIIDVPEVDTHNHGSTWTRGLGFTRDGYFAVFNANSDQYGKDDNIKLVDEKGRIVGIEKIKSDDTGMDTEEARALIAKLGIANLQFLTAPVNFANESKLTQVTADSLYWAVKDVRSDVESDARIIKLELPPAASGAGVDRETTQDGVSRRDRSAIYQIILNRSGTAAAVMDDAGGLRVINDKGEVSATIRIAKAFVRGWEGTNWIGGDRVMLSTLPDGGFSALRWDLTQPGVVREMTYLRISPAGQLLSQHEFIGQPQAGSLSGNRVYVDSPSNGTLDLYQFSDGNEVRNTKLEIPGGKYSGVQKIYPEYDLVIVKYGQTNLIKILKIVENQ